MIILQLFVISPPRCLCQSDYPSETSDLECAEDQDTCIWLLSQAHLSGCNVDPIKLLVCLMWIHCILLTQSIGPLPFGIFHFGHFKARTSGKAPTSNEEHEGSASFMCLCTAKHRWASKCRGLISVCLCQNDASSSAIWTWASVSLPPERRAVLQFWC